MIRIRQIKIDVLKNNKENLKKIIANKLKINPSDILDTKIHKQSLDARNKELIYYVYEVDIIVNNESNILKKNHNKDIFITPNEEYTYSPKGKIKLNNRIVVVGSGPAGLFASYLLAKNGYKPLIIERGDIIDKRIEAVNNFWKTGKLNTDSNVQFGEGGAGTFSDGKLNTLVKDPNNRIRMIYNTFVKFGAPSEILYSYKPHIGTDRLIDVVKNMREDIISSGGEFLYNKTLTNIKIKDNKITAIELNNQEWLDCEILVLAIGHSARDTIEMLYNNNIKMTPKPFAVGIRVSHSQEMINVSQYGKIYKDYLGAANYKLTYKSSNGRGVYSFCMCPGGYVVNASSEENHLAINGMSYHKRDSLNANSALVVTVTPSDFGDHPLDGINFQRELERKAFLIGNGNIPIQLLKDYKENKKTEKIGDIIPLFKGKYSLANLRYFL